MSKPNQYIQEPSIKSLYLETFFNGQKLASGTGFVTESNDGPLLITNWHVVTGRNPVTKKLLSKTGGAPNSIKVLHNKANSLGTWVFKDEDLILNGQPAWHEHPTYKEKVDVVAIKLSNVDDVDLFFYPLDEKDPKISVSPAEIVSVVGFPFGLGSSGLAAKSGLALWATGFIASEFQFDFDGLPRFVIDCRSRQGQSGSPVIAFRSGAIPMEGGGTTMTSGPLSRFLGIYSGRINEESDLGFVWKVSAIREIVESITQKNSLN